MAPKTKGENKAKTPTGEGSEMGPMAMCFDKDLGAVADKLGPKSGHWKILARAAQTNGPVKEKDPMSKKRAGLIVFVW